MKAYILKNNLRGEISVPGSKSHTIRAITIATMSSGKSIIRNPLPSADCIATLNSVKLFGADYHMDDDKWIVEGVGKDLKVPDDIVDIDNSGTALYFMTALASLLPEWSVLTGDGQIRKRPINHLLEALRKLGATAFTTRDNIDAPPLIIKGPIKGGVTKLNGRLSQFVSSILLVAPMVEGDIRIEVEEPKEIPYIAMTIDWMEKVGVKVEYDRESYKYFEVRGNQSYRSFDLTIASDWSGVAFPLCAGVITDSDITIKDLSLGDVQGDAKIVDILIEMGADITINRENNSISVKGGKELNGVTVNLSNMPDSLPMLSVVGAYAKGVTRFEGVGIARAKETDRVAVMKEALTKMGVKVEDDEDSMTIYGGTPLKGAIVDSYHDHRNAMALSVAGLIAEGETIVNGADSVKVSFPNFYEAMNRLGAGYKLV
ncbi:3-phosphoshikimate 1-carboxyvinyltransferase [Tissierellaceae bacterium HCP3S3_D8]